jgi:hypothetical protein
MVRSFIVVLFILVLSCPLTAQQHSYNGWALPVKDTLRILLVFVEIDYDTLQHLEDLPAGKYEWPKGELPNYADSVFHPFYTPAPTALLTRYYHESSLGNLIVLGDYIPYLFKVPYSEILKRGQTALFSKIAADIEEKGKFYSNSGLLLKDFDLWQKSPGRGSVILPSITEFNGIDHMMVLTRNYHAFPKDNGQASPSSLGIIGGKKTDTYSIFSGGHSFPISILKHELNHLFLGGNNFHSGGGNSSRFISYTLSVQGGWSMMGAANSSLLTCNGWDRYRLGWKAKENTFLISARNLEGEEVNGDMLICDTIVEGIYILRDFQIDGDAIRIKLPFLPQGQFNQWLWLEYHATKHINESPFDKFKYGDWACTSEAYPGLFMAIQIDADTKEGRDVYSAVLADYWKPIPANGLYDFKWSKEEVKLEPCVNNQAYRTYELHTEFENPLTGNHEQEVIFAPLNPFSEKLVPADEMPPMIRKIDDRFERLNFLGHESHAFMTSGNRMAGIGTNPPTSSVLSTVNSRTPRKPDPRNNNSIYLNGISVEVLEQFSNGSAKIRIRFDDHVLHEKRRWCASAIELNNHNLDGPDLHILGHLLIDRGHTATRLDKPDSTAQGNLFTSATTMIVNANAQMINSGIIELRNGSILDIRDGGNLVLEKKSVFLMNDTTSIQIGITASVEGKGRIKIRDAARIYCPSPETYRFLRKRTWQKRKVLLNSQQLHEKSGS